jgi:hypothetical protein
MRSGSARCGEQGLAAPYVDEVGGVIEAPHDGRILSDSFSWMTYVFDGLAGLDERRCPKNNFLGRCAARGPPSAPLTGHGLAR